MATATTRRPLFEQFFAVRRYSPALSFTRDGRAVLFASDMSGQFNLWRVPVGGGWPDQLTSFVDLTVRAWAVSPADGTIAFIADRDGDERHAVYGLPEAGGWPERWTDAPEAQHLLEPGAWSPDGSRLAYCGNSRVPTDVEVIVRDAASGEERRIFGEGRYAVPASWSPDGRRLLVVDVRSNSDLSLHLVDAETGEAHELTPHEGTAKFLPGPWRPDGSGFHLVSDEGRDFGGLAFYRLDEGRYEWVATPERDVEEVAGSSDGRVLGWVENDRGWGRLRLRDVERGVDLPEPDLPQGCPPMFGSALCFSPDGARAAVLWTSPRRPTEVWVVDTATGRATAVTEGRLGGLREDDLGEVELVSYPSFDGRDIPAWLYRAERNDASPVVVAIHGGPELQERPWYQPLYQYLRSRGIAVLAPNVRGSTGYGKSYQRLIYRDWGGGDVRDWEHAARWLTAQEWVDRERIGVYGASYGGFAALSCVTRLPEHWAAAVDVFGPSSLVSLVESVPPTWRRFTAELIGDAEADRDFLLERSPITYVENVRAPLLVVQGANDYRVVKAESDQLVERLRALGRTVEYEVFDDEGHGFMRYENELRAYRLAADWLERHLA